MSDAASDPIPLRRPRVLLVSPVSPLTGRSGSEQRSHLLWRALSTHADCDLLQLEEAAGDGQPLVERLPDVPGGALVRAVLRAHRWPWQRLKPQPAWTARIEAALPRRLADYDLIVGRYLWPVSQLSLPPGVRVVVDLDDWRYRRDPLAPASGWAKLARKRFANLLAGRELHRFAAAFAVSDQDVRELQGRLPVWWLPNVPAQLPLKVTPVPASLQLLFVGSLWYAPNAEAVNWLLQQVWPRVIARVPQARLLLAGTAPKAQLRAWSAHAGVQAPGFVDDLDAAYAGSCGVLAPLLSGAGSNIKVLEAMAHGRPCVVTPLVHSAFADHLLPGQHYLVGRTADEFVALLVGLLEQPQAQQALAAAAREQVQAGFTPRLFAEVVGRLVQQMLPAAAAR